LLNHAGAGHQLKLNKAAATDTASLLFQTGFGGRAEMGTTGSDDFSVKVSADGSAFFTAFEADGATGEVTLPQPVHLGGQAADPSIPPDGTLWLNTTTGEVKVRSAGVTMPVGGGGGGVTDGDRGDISVSGGGAVWTIDAGAVGLAKLADMATDSFLGRDTAGTGAPEVLTPAQARGILNVAEGATANAADAALRDRATHSGTQEAATISDFAEAVDDRVAALLVAGSNVTLTYDDIANSLTIAATGGGGGGATDLSYVAATRTLESSTGADVVLPVVSKTDAGLAPRPEHGPQRFYDFHDMMGTNTSVFTGATSGTGAALTPVAPLDGGIGWLNFTLGTTATGSARVLSGTTLRFALGTYRYAARVRKLVLSDATNTYTERFGFIDNAATEATDGAFFRYTHSVNGGRFQAVTRNNNAETAVDTGVTLAVNTTYKLEIDVNADGTSVEFRIDGVVVATIATTIPTASGRETGAGISSARSAGTAALTPLAGDYVLVEFVPTASR
jgi:hypothetical protein